MKLFCISIILFLVSCAPRTMERPLHQERSLLEVIAERNSISQIDTTMSIVFEKVDSEIRGDAALNIFNNGNMELKVYAFGILAMEMTSREGAVKSNPQLDSTKKTIFARGLRDCLFWWDIKDFTVQDGEGYYLLINTEREITIDKKSILPQKQQVYFSNGKVLTVYYENPAMENGIRYQSKMRIELSKYSVTLTVKNIRFTM